MKVSVEELPERRVQLEIEVDEQRLETSLNATYKRIAQRTRIPGFRPGKAPRNVVEKMIGREGLIREALDKLVPDVYNEVIAEHDVHAIDQPDLEILELDPVRFTATVPVEPKVELGDYRGELRVEKEPMEVTDEMVDEQILVLRRRNATLVPVERGAQWDDVLTADVSGTIDDENFVQDDDAEFPLREGATLLVEGLAEAFLDMKAGDEKTVELTMPDDFQVERFQGKDATFKLHVKSVSEEELPEADDDFARSINAEEFETFEDLKSRIRKDMEESYEQQSRSLHQQHALDALVDLAEIDYPQVLVEREIDTLIEETKRGNDRAAFEAQMAAIGKSEAEFRDTFRETAEKRVKRSLVLGAFAENEKVELTEDDIVAEGERMIGPLGDGEQAEQLRQIFLSGEGRASISRSLLTERTLDRLASIALGEAGESGKADPGETAPAEAESADDETEETPSE